MLNCEEPDEEMIKKTLQKMVESRVPMDRISRLDIDLNEYGYDPWGFHLETSKVVMLISQWFYRRYFRVKTYGIENVPTGRVMLIANHSGQLPMDGALIGTAMMLDAEPPRLIRSMIEYWAPKVPYASTFFLRMGQCIGLPENCRRLLRKDAALLIFPEGAKGCGKTWQHRYKLQSFGTGFMRLALTAECPIVPVAVIGGEEMAPSFVNMRRTARLLGMPYLPITPTFPLTGPFGLIPYPTKYRLHFGRPVLYQGDPNDEDEVVEEMVEDVKFRLQALIDDGLRQRRHIFW